MSRSRYNLPGNDKDLRAFAMILVDELYARDLQILKMKLERAAANRMTFGRRSEKMNQEITQFQLTIGEVAAPAELLDADADETDPPVTGAHDNGAGTTRGTAPAKPKVLRGRQPLPAHLPTEEILHPVCSCPHCGGDRFSKVGEDRRRLLEYVPASFKIIEHVRPKMSCRACERIIQAPMPPTPIERGRAGPKLLAQIVVAKYQDGLPLERQSRIMKRAGVNLSRKAMCGYLGGVAPLLAPLAEAIVAHIRSAPVFHIDDTPMPVLERGRGQTREARLICMVRDERPWAGPAPPAIAYAHVPDKTAGEVRNLLVGARGYMQADADTRFKNLYGDMVDGAPRLLEVACWAHARRKFYDAWRSTNSPGALHVLRVMKKLFALERDIQSWSPAERLAMRQAKALPLIQKLKPFLEWARAAGSSIMPIDGAAKYMLDRWDSFERYATDGRLDMTNNAAERGIKPCVLGRKNYMFHGSDAGGERSAIFYTLVATARENDIDPAEYLADVIERIGSHPINRIEELLPWRWRDAREGRRLAA